MIKQLLSLFGRTAKTVRDKVDDSLDFIDDTLEAEYITGTIDKAKKASGRVVQKAGETVERGKMLAEDLLEDDRIKAIKEKGEAAVSSGKELIDKALQSTLAEKASERLKEAKDQLVEGAEEMTDRIDDYLADRINQEEE
jgi:ElaB/YqjD/DUF883 family membrane-anchored ribosome-binding protein